MAAKPKRTAKRAAPKKRAAVNTAPKQRGRPFQKGQSGNPAGRPKGSRSKLSEAFLTDFCELWTKHGMAALRKVATKDPATFVRAAVSLIPKQIGIGDGEGGPVVVHFKITRTIVANSDGADRLRDGEGISPASQ